VYSHQGAKSQVEEMMSKYSNYCMLAYGITGAGKTYTLEGLPANPGVLPRALEHLFELLQLHENADNLAVAVSYYEIYNEHIYDLLLLNPRGVQPPLSARRTTPHCMR
jgi:hypothetical protein